jgi:hypothetical protein
MIGMLEKEDCSNPFKQGSDRDRCEAQIDDQFMVPMMMYAVTLDT